MNDFCNVSVIIAAFNAEKVIDTAIQSVLAQSRTAQEIIVVDDGSRDATGDIVRKYRDRVRYIHQENAGVSAARNAGARQAVGDWLVFLDVDDRYYEHRIEAHCKLLGRYPDVGFVVGNYQYVTAEGDVISDAMGVTGLGMTVQERCGPEGEAILNGEEVGRLVSEYFGHTLSISVRRAMFDELGGFPEGYRVGEDLHLLIRLCANSRSVGVVCDPLGAYVVHDEGLVRSDTVFAQQETVRTLLTLRGIKNQASRAVWTHYQKVLLGARYDWASALLKQGDRAGALRAIAPAIHEAPGWRSMKAFLSILKG